MQIANRVQRIELIESLVQQSNAFDSLDKALGPLTTAELADELLICGIIPEQFDHDSSQEKLWAKYCDLLLARAFEQLGMQASVIRTRGDSADVLGITSEYSIVADAKAFRLSRSAKNQKDFKVTALDDWRREKTFACLVAPLFQFPSQASQIYAQARNRNVTLLGYVHLRFLLNYLPSQSLSLLWTTPQSLPSSKNASTYWKAVDNAVVQLAGQSPLALDKYKSLATQQVVTIAHEGLAYWETVVDGYRSLTRQELLAHLIHSEKIDQKISTIRRTVAKLGTNTNE